MTGRRVFIVITVGLLAVWVSISGWRRWKAAQSAIDFLPDITYSVVDGAEQRLNLARPRHVNGPLPCILFFHGGGWRAGNRSDLNGTIGDVARRGYVAVSVSYRFCPQYQFPAQVQDARCAVRFLRANAAKYGIDPAHIGAIGYSAGAYLALMLGVLDPSDGWEDTGGSTAESSKVQAVVSFYGPTNFDDPYYDADPGMLRDFFGARRAENRDLYRRGSPISYMTSGDAPIFILHGGNDALVPNAQVEAFFDAMQKADIPGRLEIVAGENHGFRSEELTRTTNEAIAFCDQYLKPHK